MTMRRASRGSCVRTCDDTAAMVSVYDPRMDESAQASVLVRRLSLVIFLSWLGATAVLPLLPLYLKQKGSTPATTGVVMASFFIAGVVLQYPAGKLSDRVGRKPVLIGGLIAYAVASLGFILPLAPLAYGSLRFVQGGAAGAIEVATLATVALVVPDSQRGRASSRIYAGQLGGAAFGPLLGAFIGVREMGYVFVAAGCLAILAALPVLRRDLGPRHVQGDEPGHVTFDARLAGAIALAIAVGMTIGAYESCWTLLMHYKGASTFQLGLSWMLFALPYVFFFRVGGWAADHADRRILAAVGAVNAAAFCAIYPLLGPVDALLALSCFEAIGTSLALPSTQSILTEGADPRSLGRRQGIFTTAQTSAMAISAIVSGVLFQIGPAVPFVTMALIATVFACVAPVLWRRVPGHVAPLTAAVTPPL
jgi:MFS transporter, DHA1 family, multidrug resistance protein